VLALDDVKTLLLASTQIDSAISPARKRFEALS